jgi:hypothetical protein
MITPPVKPTLSIALAPHDGLIPVYRYDPSGEANIFHRVGPVRWADIPSIVTVLPGEANIILRVDPHDGLTSIIVTISPAGNPIHRRDDCISIGNDYPLSVQGEGS